MDELIILECARCQQLTPRQKILVMFSFQFLKVWTNVIFNENLEITYQLWRKTLAAEPNEFSLTYTKSKNSWRSQHKS
jgi:hypothetical protein